MSVELRPARDDEEGAIVALVREAGLPSEDIALARQRFAVAAEDGVVVGCVALEPLGDVALLRSLAVAPAWRGRRLGDALAARALEEARRAGIRELYLLTTTAEGFFAARGFERVARETMPPAVLASPEASSLCPASAVCMRRRP